MSDELDLDIEGLQIGPQGIERRKPITLPALIPPTYDAETLDIEQLTDIYNRGSAATVGALFSQAEAEAHRINKVRANLDTVEELLYDPETLGKMTPGELIATVGLTQKALGQSTGYLFKLHQSMTQGLEAISTIGKQRSGKVVKKKDPQADVLKRQLGDLILQKIKEKAI